MILSCDPFPTCPSKPCPLPHGPGDNRAEKELMSCLEHCSSCLEQVCHLSFGKTAVREADGIRALGAVLTLARFNIPVQVCGHPLMKAFFRHATFVAKTPSPAQRKTTAALAGVSVEKESKMPLVLHAGSALVKLLQSDNMELVTNARAALTSACELLEARAMLTSSMNERDQVKTLFLGPLPPSPPDFRYKVGAMHVKMFFACISSHAHPYACPRRL